MRALIVIAALVLITAVPGRPASGAYTPTLYLALGDSLAEGFGASHPELTGYVPRVFRYLHAASNGSIDTVLNLARGGESTTEFIGGPMPTQLGLALAAIADPDTDTQVVTIGMGADDLFDDVLFKNPACIADPLGAECFAALASALAGVGTNLSYILAALTAALAAEDAEPEALYAFTYFNPWSGTGQPFEAPTDLLLLGADGKVDCAGIGTADTGLNDIISCIAPFFDATVVDLYPVFAGRALELTHIAAGDVHPNDEGYAAIATAFRRSWRA